MKQVGSVRCFESKLDSCEEEANETKQSLSIRFRGEMSEFKNIAKSLHERSMERRITLDKKKMECLQKYMMKEIRETGLQIKAQKPTNIGEAQNLATEMENHLRENQLSVSTLESE